MANTGPALGGGPFNGWSPVQTIGNEKASDEIMARRIVRKSWNTAFTGNTVNGYGRIVTPFRAVNNLGDYLQRQNYTCGGSNQVNADYPGWKSRIGSIINQCDGTGIGGKTGNVRYVPDSSDYITYKKLVAQNRNYNDLKNGGYTNSAYVPLMAVRRR